MARPIKVHIIVPIMFVIICIFLLILPVVKSPLVLLGGVMITLSGVPVYYFGIMQEKKPKKFNKFMSKFLGDRRVLTEFYIYFRTCDYFLPESAFICS